MDEKNQWMDLANSTEVTREEMDQAADQVIEEMLSRTPARPREVLEEEEREYLAEMRRPVDRLEETIREQGEENATLGRKLEAVISYHKALERAHEKLFETVSKQGERIKALEEEKEQDHRLLGALLEILGVDPMELGVAAALMFQKKTNHDTEPKKTDG